MTNNQKKNVEMVSDMVNSFSFDAKAFCKEFTNEHRTLQQSFTNLCLEWLRTCASDNYRTDARNEMSHKIAKELFEGHEDLLEDTLPMI